jgi:hypothetical protein
MCFLCALLAPLRAEASSPPVPGTGAVIELDHAIELSLTPEGATLQVTRTLFNAGVLHGQVELPIPLPCSATLDQVAIEERDEQGLARWRPAELLDETDAAQRWSLWLDGPGDGVATVLDADAALHMSRDDYSCEALLEVYPIPPVHTRRVSYRVFVPSQHVDGHHEIELPSFDAHGEVASLSVTPWHDPEFRVELDGAALADADVTLLGDQPHSFSLWRRDAGLGLVRAVDLDLAGLIASTPSATAKLEPDEVPGRLLSAAFEAPRELASLPPVRRVVVLLDTSRSLDAWDRQKLQELGARYLELLGQHARLRVEIVLFDRELRRVYHDFAPGAWAIEDLRDLAVDELGNGSELGAAIIAANELLASPSERDGADWVLVLSDLHLRSGFPLVEQLDVAAHSSTRMHVVRPVDDNTGFHPGGVDEAWSMIARESGGMLWYASASEIDELAHELEDWMKDLEGGFFEVIEALAPELHRRLRAGKREDNFIPGRLPRCFFRKPYGPGWALVGDAGAVYEYSTAQGITNALRQAQLAADAVDAGLAGRKPMDEALADFERARNEVELPYYDFTYHQGTFQPPDPDALPLFAAVARSPKATSGFFGLFSQTTSPAAFFAPEHLGAIMSGQG